MADNIYQSGIVQVRGYRIIQATVASTVRRYGLGSVSEWFMLAYIHAHTDTTAKDLAALLHVEAPLATKIVSHLHEMGLVTITPHPTDGRVKHINTQPPAAALITTIEQSLEKEIGCLLEGISPEDLETYGNVLEKIIKNGSKHEKDL